MIPPQLVTEFKKKFNKTIQISVPSELNGLEKEKITIYRDTFTIKNPIHASASEHSISVKSAPDLHQSP